MPGQLTIVKSEPLTPAAAAQPTPALSQAEGQAGGLSITKSAPPTPAPKRMFRDPMTITQFRDADAANGEQLSAVLQEHPVLASAILALASGGSSVGRQVMGKGLSMAGRAAAGAKAAVGAAAPQVKYELVKQGLERVGLPSAVAIPLAIAASGYKSKPAATAAPAPAQPAPSAPPVAATPAPVAAPVAPPVVPAGPRTVPARVVGAPTPASAPAPVASPVASTPAAPASPVASAAPASGPAQIPAPAPSAPMPGRQVMSPQRIQNELGIMARRANLQLTPEEYQAATQLVGQGRTPAQAVAEIHLQRPAGGTPPPAPAAPQAAPAVQPPPDISPDEVNEFYRLLKIGKSPQQAAALLKKQRDIAATLGIPTPSQVRTRVAARNASGRWPKE